MFSNICINTHRTHTRTPTDLQQLLLFSALLKQHRLFYMISRQRTSQFLFVGATEQ